MGYTYYCTHVLLPPDHPLTFAGLAELFQEKAKRSAGLPQVVIETRRVVLKRGVWSLDVYWEDEPHVLEESRECAEAFAVGRPDADAIALCNRRITTAGDPDPDMHYFNDYVFVLEVLDTLSGVFRFEPDEGKFVNVYGKD